MVICVVVSVEAAVLRPRAEGNSVVGDGLGRRREGGEDPSIKGVQNLPGRERGLLPKAEKS